MIELDSLRYTYLTRSGSWWAPKTTEVVALRGVSLQVPAGQLFGILGPNGAGKTTLFRILATLLIPTSGRAVISGADSVRDSARVRQVIGVSFGGEQGFYGRLSARDNIRYAGVLYGLRGAALEQRVQTVLEQVALHDRADVVVQTFSRGMKQRLHIARALIHMPQVLLLDEPTSGLDPTVARDLRDLVRTLAHTGTTVLLSTHYMLEAHELCATVAVMRAGEVLAVDTPEALRLRHGGGSVVEVRVSHGAAALIEAVSRIPGVVRAERRSIEPYELVSIHVEDSSVVRAAVQNQLPQEAVVTIRPSTLEDAYLALIAGTPRMEAEPCLV